jgi:perosamine synthetase
MIPHSRTRLGDPEVEAAARVIRSGVVNDSAIREAFERALAARVGRRYGWATSTGTFALYFNLRLLGVEPGDEVVVPTYVCDDVLSAVLQAGAKPVPADLDPEDFNVDAADIRRKISPATRAIIVAHMFGMPVRGEALSGWPVPVIEDCAHALGATSEGRPAGALARSAVFSFHGLKVLTTGEGGMILADDEALRQRKERFDRPDFARGEFALHFHLSNILAAVGLAQLHQYDEILRRRREIAAFYEAALDGLGGARLPPRHTTDRESACYRYCLLLRDGLTYSEAERAFAAAGVVVRRPVKSLLHRALGLGTDCCPASENCFDRIVSIPAFPDLTDDEMHRVAEVTRRVLG